MRQMSDISNTLVLSTRREIRSHIGEMFFIDKLPHRYFGLYTATAHMDISKPQSHAPRHFQDRVVKMES